ncbi:MAG: DUF459 domain-containing protein, partial [Solirubrobacteraceae bacterium]|nr:DUF459 domain-containing protein [Solirubrobacteraceae bacterium]
AVLCVVFAMVLLIGLEGASLRESGREMQPGWERTFVRAAGEPAGWVADLLPLADVTHDATAWLSPDGEANRAGGFTAAAGAVDADATSDAPAPVGVDSFEPRELGEANRPPRALRFMLVTGDSLAMPLDAVLGRRVADAGTGVQVYREPHVGTALSQTDLLDWGAEARAQVDKHGAEATVIFIGANEGFPMEGADGKKVTCCGRAWAAVYADRARQMMHTYRQKGTGRVYWLLLPAPRDPARQKISRAVNAAIRVAAQPYRAQVRVVGLDRVFTPGGRYRDAMEVDGRERIVRESDGIHLNEAGAQIAADVVLATARQDYPDRLPG